MNNEAADHSGLAAEAGVRAKNSLHEISVRNCGACSFHWWSNALGAGLRRVWNI